MAKPPNYSKIPLGAVRALSGEDSADFAVYLEHKKGDAPVLYRAAGAELTTPDFERLTEGGLQCLLVQPDDLRKCEAVLERRLRDVLDSGEGTPAERAQLVAHVGTSIARDLSGGPCAETGLARANTLLDSIIGGVLSDPSVSANILSMAAHEAGTATHMFVVSTLAVLLGSEILGDDATTLRELGLAGMMHDIGKLAIPVELLNKEGLLTPEEFSLIQQHPVESVRLLREDPTVSDSIRRIILEHHERMDGGGYPLGLPGEDISPSGRILSIVDSYHAMIGNRGYRVARTASEAMATIVRNAGRQFDADYVRCWTDLMDRLGGIPTVDVVTNTASDGEVLSSRHEHRTTAPRRNAYGNRAKRFACHTPKSIRCIYAGGLFVPKGKAREFTADVRDASRSGLCVSCAGRMYRGEIVNVLIDGGGSKQWVRSIVAWCRRVDSSSFRCGVQFLQRLTPDEIYLRAPVQTLTELQQTLLGTAPPTQPEQLLAKARPVTNADMENSMQEAKQENTPGDTSATGESPRATLREAQELRDIPIALERKVIALASHADADLRKDLVPILAKINSRPARGAIAGLIVDPDNHVCIAAIESAGLLELHEASGKLHKRLKDSDVTIMLRAAASLAQLGDENATAHVVKVVQGDGPHVRLAARILGTILGQRFPGNAEGVAAARRYIKARSLASAV